jgi:hypothetical protein
MPAARIYRTLKSTAMFRARTGRAAHFKVREEIAVPIDANRRAAIQ